MFLISAFYGIRKEKKYKNVTDFLSLFIIDGKIVIPSYVDLNNIFGSEGDLLIITYENYSRLFDIFYNIENGHLIDSDRVIKIPRSRQPNEKTSRKVCIFYVYSERPNTESEKNLRFLFRNNFIFDVDFYLIVNSDDIDKDKQEIEKKFSFAIRKFENLKVLYRRNTGYDYGGYIHGCNFLSEISKRYDYYIFLNDSCIGPFINPHVLTETNWVNYLIRRFESDEKIGIIGSTLNLNGYSSEIAPHVQGYMFMLSDKSYSQIRNSTDILSTERTEKQKIITEQEVGLSTFLLSEDYKISSLIHELSLVSKEKIPVFYRGDCLWRRSENLGRVLNPTELIFCKSNLCFDNIDHQIKDILIHISSF